MKKLLTLLFLFSSLLLSAQKVDTIFKQDAYVSYYSFTLKNPLMVTYILYKGGGSCSRDMFRFTGGTVPSTKMANATDYAKSDFDKGHLANAEDFAYNCTLDESTFRYWNCCPQTAQLNRGIWKTNETYVRKLSQTDSIRIICGSIYGTKTIGKNVFVPEQCWKIAYSLITKKILFCYIFTNTETPTMTAISYEDLNKLLSIKYQINLNSYIK